MSEMLCPKCNKQNPDGTAICQHCDNILDASFLGDGYTGEEQVPSLPPRRGTAPSDEYSDAARQKTQTKEKAPWEDAAPPTPGSDQEPYDEVEKERQRLRQARQVVLQQPKAMRIEEEKSENYQEAAGTLFADAIKMLQDWWRNFLALSKPDRLAVGGALATVFCTFLPWMKIVSAGSLTLLGLQMDGFLLVLLAVAVTTAVVLRHRESWQDKQRILLYGQAGASGLSLLFVLLQMLRLEAYAKPDADSPLPVTVNVEPGVVLAFAAAAVMAAGSWLTLKPLLKKK